MTGITDLRVPDLRGKVGLSTPAKTDNVNLTRKTVEVTPVRKTSRLGVTLLIAAVALVVPLSMYVISHLPIGNDSVQTFLSWDVAIILVLMPISVYGLKQNANKIFVQPATRLMRYQTALGSSISFYYSQDDWSDNFSIVYFANTTAKSVFNRKGWAVFYRGDEILFRLNMERWDEADLWWIAENLRWRIMVFREHTRISYIQKRFPGYFPMFAAQPITSAILVVMGVAVALLLETSAWALVLHLIAH